METAPRRYRGQSAADRRDSRHAALVEAAIRLYGERGFANTSIEAVCAEAGLIKRYFYESFDSAEALLVAAFARISTALFERIDAVADPAGTGGGAGSGSAAAAMLTAFFTALRDHPQFARVFFVEMSAAGPAAAAALETTRLALAGRLGNVDAAGSLAAAGSTGAIRQIALHWIAGGFAEPLCEVVRTALAFCQQPPA